MKFHDDHFRDSPEEDYKAFPVTSNEKIELDSRLRAYEGDKNRGRPAADVLADLRRRLCQAQSFEVAI